MTVEGNMWVLKQDNGLFLLTPCKTIARKLVSGTQENILCSL